MVANRFWIMFSAESRREKEEVVNSHHLRGSRFAALFWWIDLENRMTVYPLPFRFLALYDPYLVRKSSILSPAGRAAVQNMKRITDRWYDSHRWPLSPITFIISPFNVRVVNFFWSLLNSKNNYDNCPTPRVTRKRKCCSTRPTTWWRRVLFDSDWIARPTVVFAVESHIEEGFKREGERRGKDCPG